MAEMTPVEWAVRPLVRYAQFSGRAPRAEYWWFYLGTIVVGFVAELLDGSLTSDDIGWLSLVVNLALIVPTIAVTVRRLHDTDRSGWWIIVALLPLVAMGFLAGAGLLNTDFETLSPALWAGILAFLVAVITLFIFMVLPGTDGPNRFGEDPYQPERQLEEIFG